MPLGKRTDCGDAKYAGVEVPFACDIVTTLEASLLCGFDFVVAPLAHPRYRRPATSALPKGTFQPPFTRSDLLLTSAQWSGQVVGKVSPWVDPDSPNPALKRDSEAALAQELAWAAHLSLQACLLPPPPQPLNAANYARILNQVIGGLTNMALWLRIPLAQPDKASLAPEGAGQLHTEHHHQQQQQQQQQQSPAAGPSAADSGGGSDGMQKAVREGGERASLAAATAAAAPVSAAASSDPRDPRQDPWEWWNQMRFLCEHSTRLGAVLELGADLPPTEDLARWHGEPVKAVVVPTSVFMTNRRGYPTLSRRHQDFLSDMFQRGVQVVLSGNAHHSVPEQQVAAAATSTIVGLGPNGTAQLTAPGQAHPLRVYWEYLSYTFRKLPAATEQDLVEMTYRDFLQARSCPLQPLQDNLESATYETFERDATKYSTYEEAVYRALLDRVPQEQAADPVTVLMVVGAGRGPLVRASLKASARAGRALRVYAVEKNPNAVVTLHNLIASEGWQDRVTVVPADMREWEAPELADILVSELLGSFGDNELSPECLDGAQRFLKPGGISIPRAYTSFLHPITSHKLWNDVKAYDDVEHFETPYVVKIFKFHALAAPQAVFTFEHPNRDLVIDNSRSRRLVFDCTPPGGTVCHGLAGYFDAQLYGDVHLSIHPETHTPNMFSWFPIYFPLRQPFYVPQGSQVEVSMWRCAAKHKVWYEWAVTRPTCSPIHNPSGRSYYVGL
ncbi:hypothetical protein N2152v2_008397 [Parachlorella kessleri]